MTTITTQRDGYGVVDVDSRLISHCSTTNIALIQNQ